MLQRCMIAALTVIGATASLVLADPPAPAPEASMKAAIAWKFEKDKTFYQKMTTTTKQTMKVLNNDVADADADLLLRPRTPTANMGEDWTVTQKIIGVEDGHRPRRQQDRYDSTKPGNRERG